MTNFTKIFILPSMERNPHQLSTHWRPQQPSHRRPPDFNWRPQDFHRRPHIFIETPDVQWTPQAFYQKPMTSQLSRIKI